MPLLALLALAAARPQLTFANPAVQQVLGVAYDDALKNLLDISTIPYDPAKYDNSGLLQGKPGSFLRAGGGYQEPWTRDASINSWNAASLLEPDVAQNTLFAVLGKDSQGQPIVQRDNQWWDKVVWIVGAWNHYKTTGDKQFLDTAYGVSTRLLAAMRAEHFDTELGLYQGPSFFNDGIAGYPAPPAPADDDKGSTFVLDHPGTDKLMALSTNCLYVGAYRTAALMAAELGRPKSEAQAFNAQADALKATINRHFWNPERGLYAYLIHGDGSLRGQVDPSEEGSGLSYAILFDVASPGQAKSILAHTHIQPYGIADVYPNFPRYSDAHPGRHNNIIWPMVEGLWARAATQMRDSQTFGRETMNLAHLALSSGGNFYEIYDAKTGKVDGGWQSKIHFNSVPNQTWSASAYVSMITNGLFGMRFETDGLRFDPLVPKGWGDATLAGIPYRSAHLTIHLHGEGSHARSIRMDGKPLKSGKVPAILTGSHILDIDM